MPDWAISGITNRIKKPVSPSKLPHTRKKLAFCRDEINCTVLLPSSRMARFVSSSQSRFPLVSRSKSARCLRSSKSSVLRSFKVGDDGALVVHSDRNNSAGDAFS